MDRKTLLAVVISVVIIVGGMLITPLIFPTKPLPAPAPTSQAAPQASTQPQPAAPGRPERPGRRCPRGTEARRPVPAAVGTGLVQATVRFSSARLAGRHVRQGDGPVHPHLRGKGCHAQFRQAEEVQEPGQVARGHAAAAAGGDHGRDALRPVVRRLHGRPGGRSLHPEGNEHGGPVHVRFQPDVPLSDEGPLHAAQDLRVRQGRVSLRAARHHPELGE